MKDFKSYLKFSAFALIFLIIAACSGSKADGSAKSALSAFLNGNDNVVAFGNADLKDILSKADYKNIPKLGKLLDGEMSTLEKIIDFDSPVYYALEGPFDKDGAPTSTYGFLEIKNKQALIDELTKRGFDVNEKGKMSYTEDGDFVFGFEDKIAVFVTKKGDFDGEKLIASAFKKSTGKTSGGTIDEILDQDGDVILGMNVESLYGTSNTDLSNLSKEQHEELEELTKGSFVQTVFKFENGAAIIESKNHFSSALKDKMFFKSANDAPVVEMLGSGSPRLGVSINLDMKKLTHFMEDYSPETLDKIAGSLGPAVQGGLMLAGKDGLAALFDGRLGLVMVGDPGANGSMIPDFNAFVGMTERGKDMAKMMGDMNFEFAKISPQNGGLSMSSNQQYAYKSSGNKLNLPDGCENFGKSSVSLFLNLDGLDMDDFDLEGEANLLRVVKYVTFDYDENGGALYIKAKKGQENVLKQAMDVLVEEFSSEIGSL